MAKPRVCRVADVPENTLRECEVEGGVRLVVANAGGEFVAFQAMCPHQDVPLCEGLFDGQTLTCHMHLWQWDVKTGAPQGIAEAPLQKYPLSVEGDSIYLGGEASAIDVGELFNGIAPQSLEALAAIAQREEYAEGAVIYRIGDAASDFFVLESGRVEFLIGRGEKQDPAGFMMRKGEVIGWAALLESHPQRIASAKALEKSSLLRINGKQALKILEADPASGYTVMRRLSGVVTRFLTPAGAQ
jgi:toluene monooxygenase system ferredoxin subunit